MSAEAWSNLKTNVGECEGDRSRCSADLCPGFGVLRASRDGKRRVRECGDPAGRGRQNKRLGGKRQAKAARALGLPVSTLKPGNEEFFGGFVRIEVKSGAQVGPVLTRYLAAEAQSEGQRPVGDHRPFVFVAMPDGMNDGLVVCRLSKVDDVVVALAEQLGLVP